MKNYRLLAACAVIIAMNAGAQAPEMFRYQGRLVDGTNLVNATLPMSFKLYGSPVGGSALYEDSSSVLVVDGLYATYIGDHTVFGSLAAALSAPAVYLELTVNGETLSPREQLVSVPYALNTRADPTPSGTIVLSATHPNPALEAQGYSLYYEDAETADWEAVNDAPYIAPLSSVLFGFGNQLGVFSSSPESKVSLTENGKSWIEQPCPVNFSGFRPKAVEFNGAMFFFETDFENKACSTTDFESWNVWTNQFSTNMYDSFYLDEVVVFNDALWAFVRNSWPSNFVMRSTDGMSWTEMAPGEWSDLSMYGDVLTSGDRLFVNSPDSLTLSNYVWSSSDGISWNKSASTTPSGFTSPTLVFHDSALWSIFTSGVPAGGGELWKSLNAGDSWSLVTTNLPPYTIMGRYRVMSHENKFWLWGNDSGTASMEGAVLWSADGINGTTSLKTGYMSEGSDIIALDNGRLWLNKGDDAVSGPALYYIGGPKKDDGLYYYRKD